MALVGGARGEVRPSLGGAGRAGQCIRPGCSAGPGGERTGMGRAFRPGTRGDGGSVPTPKRPGGTREGPGNPLGRRRP